MSVGLSVIWWIVPALFLQQCCCYVANGEIPMKEQRVSAEKTCSTNDLRLRNMESVIKCSPIPNTDGLDLRCLVSIAVEDKNAVALKECRHGTWTDADLESVNVTTTTTTTTENTNKTNINNNSSDNTGIIGIVIGAVVLFVFVAVCVIVLACCKKKNGITRRVDAISFLRDLPKENSTISMQDITYDQGPVKDAFKNPYYNIGASREVPDNVRPSLSPPPSYRDLPAII